MKRLSATNFQPSWYTVVGVYSDNWQKSCDHILACDATHAEELVRNNPEVDDDLVIVAVFEGQLMAVDNEPLAHAQHVRLTPSLGKGCLMDLFVEHAADITNRMRVFQLE